MTHLVQNQVTPCRVCEFRGLENLRMHGVKGRRPLENWVFQSEKCSKNTLVMGDFNWNIAAKSIRECTCPVSFESEKQSEIIILRVNTCTSQFKYESIEIQMTRYCYSFNLHVRTQPHSLYCITSNIKYVIIKECKQKDDLVNYTESATQSLSVYSVQHTLHHELLSSHLCRRVHSRRFLKELSEVGNRFSRNLLSKQKVSYNCSDCTVV